MPLSSFVFGVVGNFSGRAGTPRWEERLVQSRFRETDRDELDGALRQLAPEVRLDLPFCRSLQLRRLADFHPDGLVDRIPALGRLLEARQAVADPTRMRRLLQEAGSDPGVLGAEPAGTGDRAAKPEAPAAKNDAELLDAMLGGEPRKASSGPRAYTGDAGFDRMLHEIIDGSSQARDFAREDRWREAIDAELSARVRAILQHSSFRVLESSWASLRRLVLGAETGVGLRIRILDLGQADLAAETAQAKRLEDTTLYRRVVDPEGGHPSGEGFDLLCTDFAFPREDAKLTALAALAELARRAGIPVLAAWEPSPQRAGDPSEIGGEAWDALRAHPGAGRVGLCAPRLLLRPPYEPAANPVESFEFSEGARVEDADSYLWGSAAFALAGAVARAWAQEASLAGLDRYLEVGGLPIHVYREGGEVRYQGPTEAELSESVRERWVRAGVIPVTAVRGRDSARIASLRSLAGTPLFLAG